MLPSPAMSTRLSPWLLLGAFAATASLGGEAQAQERFALQVFHFNVQYVCGGTLGYTAQPNPILDLDNDATEDRIITESLAPVIDLFEQHPTWGVDIEMQGYMLDIIAWRHPDLLDKLRTMAQSGQIDVVSFHYSDQLFIGYPEEDWERSQELTAAVFAEHDVPLSRSVFCQEGQAAPAMAQRMAERGYRNMIWPKNLWSYQHGDSAAEPLYQFGDIFLVQGGKGVSYDDGNLAIEVQWTFLDDGELLATGNVNPYFPELFWADPAAVAEYETQLSDLEAQGYRIATVDQYVEAVKDQLTINAAPPLLDGTWQPNSTDGTSRWLGGRGLFYLQERDNHVRTVGAQAHRELVAAETIAAEAGLDARAELDAAWRLLFLGQVTDATGINPFRGEIQYGIAHMSEAMRIAHEVIRQGKAALGHTRVLIDPAAGTVAAGSEEPFVGSATDAPISLDIRGGDRPVSERWELLEPGHWRLTIDFGAGEVNTLSVALPGELEDTFLVGQALADDTPTQVERSAFAFEYYYFALPTGLIGLGGGRYVIADIGQMHLAARIDREAAGVTFVDETAPTFEPQRWVLHLLEGSADEAAALAVAINTQRRVLR